MQNYQSNFFNRYYNANPPNITKRLLSEFYVANLQLENV